MSADAKATRSLNAYDYNVNHRPKVAPARQIFLIRATSTVLVPDGSLWNCLGELQIGKEPKSAKQHTNGVHEILVKHRAHLRSRDATEVRSTEYSTSVAQSGTGAPRKPYFVSSARCQTHTVLPPCCCSCACKSPSLTPDWALSRYSPRMFRSGTYCPYSVADMCLG